MIDPSDEARRLGCRIIGVERPGYGLSTSVPGRELLDWPAVVEELVDALGIKRFAVLGYSGGGPFAAACASSMGERVTGVGLVGAMGPAHAPGQTSGLSWTLSGKTGWSRMAAAKTSVFAAKRLSPILLRAGRLTASRSDRRVLTSEGFQVAFDRNMGEAFRQGDAGLLQDADIYSQPWGFSLNTIETAVHLWHGQRDRNVPASVAEYVAANLPKCDVEIRGNDGHLSIMFDNVEGILLKLKNDSSLP